MIKEIKNQKGQSFVEFVLLLSMLTAIGLVFLATINGGIATRWKTLVIMISSPSMEKLDKSIDLQ